MMVTRAAKRHEVERTRRTVEQVRILREHANLGTAAEHAVRQGLFEPVIVDGVPGSVIQTVAVSVR